MVPYNTASCLERQGSWNIIVPQMEEKGDGHGGKACGYLFIVDLTSL